MLPDYAELHALSNFSFQRGASHPQELVERAHALGYSALALDMYGDGKHTQHPEDAKAFMNAALADPAWRIEVVVTAAQA